MITDQLDTVLPAHLRHLPVKTPYWLAAEAGDIGRILYQLGNSPLHDFMVPLMVKHPGVVALHETVLERLCGVPGAQSRPGSCGWVLDTARSVVVHSDHCRRLCIESGGRSASTPIEVIQHPRALPNARNRALARRELGLNDDDFLVCSFGILDPSKQCERILQAWRRSGLAAWQNAMLVFVGANLGYNPAGEFIHDVCAGTAGHVQITGWATRTAYRRFLAAADIAVQLRRNSKGQTSGALLDCLAHGVPIILNRHGPAAGYTDRVALALPDGFHDADLADSLLRMRSDPALRERLSRAGPAHVRLHNDPGNIARHYADVIESAFGGDAARTGDVSQDRQTLGG